MYKFYGNDDCDVIAINNNYPSIKNPKDLYDALSNIWCKYTCAPRLRENWSKENMTLGQCSITSFLVQDIFGGTVYGIALDDGNYHCFNKVGNCVFDLTSEQFDYALNYQNCSLQSRDIHFQNTNKKERYEYLKKELAKIKE